MFERIANGAVPILIHCAAGKDRTGVAIALLLAALDVPYETILDDYLLTNDAGNFEQFILTRDQAELGLATTNHPLLTIPDDIRQVIFSAHAEFLQGAFEQIHADHGGVDTYLRHHGVDDGMRERARDALLG
jgi:protein-tyrosine phosphatase